MLRRVQSAIFTSGAGFRATLPAATVAALLLMTGPGETLAAPGQLDPTFAAGAGQMRLSVTPGSDDCRAMVVQPDGKMVLAATVQQGTARLIGLVRLNTDGTLDPTFGTGGKSVARCLPPNASISALQLLSDGRFVAAGILSDASGNSRFLVARFHDTGAPDSSFGENGFVATPLAGIQAVATCLAVQSDGRPVVGGYLWNGSASDFVAVRYNTDGTLDASFDGDGAAQIDMGTSQDFAYGVAIQPDGKIVLAGTTVSTAGVAHMAVARLTTSGSPDATFDGDGRLGLTIGATGDGAYAVVMDPGSGAKPDRIIVVGFASDSGPLHNGAAVVRLNLNGTFDLNFDGDGKVVTTPAGRNTIGQTVVVQRNRGNVVGIVVAGASGGTGGGDFVVIRYSSAGALDTTFDGDGMAFPLIGASLVGCNAVRLASNGILVAGSAQVATGLDMAVVQLTSSGALDATFNGNGVRFVNAGDGIAGCDALALQTDGRILIAGTSDADRPLFELLRRLPDGSVDSTFGTNGEAGTTGAATAYPHCIALQSDARILVGGDRSPGALVARYLANGQLDPTFGSAGVVTFGATALTTVRALVPLASGKLLVAGEYMSEQTNPQTVLPTIWRLNANGSSDPTFGFSGFVRMDTAGVPSAMALDSGGRIVLCGTKNGQMVAWRCLATGAADPAFPGYGSTLSIGSGSVARALVVQPDDKIVLAGSSTIGYGDNVTLARLTTSGSPDAGFGSSGVAVRDLILGNDRGYALARQADGGFLVAGMENSVTFSLGSFWASGEFVVVAFRADGTPDNSYGQFGTTVLDLGGSTDDVAVALALDAQGRAMIGGNSEGYIGLARLQASALAAVPQMPTRHAELRLAPPMPNPFHQTARVAFALAAADRIQLDVLDVNGRRVRELLHAQLEAGPHSVVWDGRDDAGRLTASGVYCVALRGRMGSEVRKLVLAR